MSIFQPGINEYLLAQLDPSPSPLDEMEQYARENGFPIIGPLVGRFLQQLVVLTGARRVFELGSGYGYSALWMSMVLPKDGKVICTDTDADNKQRAMEYFKRTEHDSKLDFRLGEATAQFKEESGPFDIILNDIDKEGYPDTIALVKDRLRSGGIFVTDNVLWSGRILEEKPEKQSTAAIQKFTRMLYEDSDFITTIVPLRDGITVALRR
jgi:predicted O-methyltransferase YrrM